MSILENNKELYLSLLFTSCTGLLFTKALVFPGLYISILIINFLIFLIIFSLGNLNKVQIFLILIILFEIFFFRILGIWDRLFLYGTETSGYLAFQNLDNMILMPTNISGFIWVNIMTSSFLFGIYFALKTKNLNLVNHDFKLYGNNFKLAFFILLTIFLTGLTGTAFLEWNPEARWNEEFGFQELFIKSFIPLAIVFCIILFKEGSKIVKFFALFSIFLIILFTFFSGIRTLIIYSVLPLAYFLFPLRLWKILLIPISIFLFMIIFLIQELGRSFISGFSFSEITNFIPWIFEILNSYGISFLELARMTLEFEAHIDIDVTTFYKIEDGSLALALGATFLKPIFFIVPRSLYELKPDGYSVQLAQELFPEIPGFSCGTGVIGEMFYNFGFFSPLFIFLVSLIFTKFVIFISHSWGKNTSARYNLLCFAFIPIFLDFYRAPFSDTVLVFLVMMLPLFFYVKLARIQINH